MYLQDHSRENLAALLAQAPYSLDAKKAKYHARHIFKWAYDRAVLEYENMTDLPKSVRNQLALTLPVLQPYVVKQLISKDGTKKALLQMPAKDRIETVYLRTPNSQGGHHYTVCVSSQVGCALDCKFCLTGKQGLKRNLSAGEIVSQVHHFLREGPVDRIVFMGMGEPLHNVSNVIDACNILKDEAGTNFSNRHITVSTAGIVPAIEKLANGTKVKLAVSLNASNDQIREKIMPVNKKWQIGSLLGACSKFPRNPFTRVTLEYVLLKGINDKKEHAQELASLIKSHDFKVNLIPFNEHPGSTYQAPGEETVSMFHEILVAQSISTTVRRSGGRDILAACGQLSGKH